MEFLGGLVIKTVLSLPGPGVRSLGWETKIPQATWCDKRKGKKKKKKDRYLCNLKKKSLLYKFACNNCPTSNLEISICWPLLEVKDFFI